MPIDFLGIQAFLAVAESGSFQLAAARLHLSQTAISHRMRKLEESLGAQLLVRTSRGIALTAAGDALLPRARLSVQQLEVSCEAVRRHGEQASRWLSFGCLPTLATGLLVPLLQDFSRQQPQVQLRVFDSSPTEIIELVQARTAAFGLTVLRPVPERLVMQPIAREPFVLVCPHGHALASRRAVSWDELTGQPLIRISLPSGNSMTLDDAIGARRERLDWRYEAQRNALALDMVRGGLGLTVVPQLSVGATDGLAVLALVEPQVSRSLALLTRRGEALGGPEQDLAEAAAARLRAVLPPAGLAQTG